VRTFSNDNRIYFSKEKDEQERKITDNTEYLKRYILMKLKSAGNLTQKEKEFSTHCQKSFVFRFEV
jgi:hypothetical protein